MRSTSRVTPFSGQCVVIPLALPLSSSADYERTTAYYLARDNTVVLYRVYEGKTLFRWLRHPEPILSRKGTEYIYTPLYIIPFHRFSNIASVNHWICTKLLLLILRFFLPRTHKGSVLWMFSLQYAVLPRWFGNQFFKIYDCVDGPLRINHSSGFPHVEDAILSGTHVVFANSRTLFTRLFPRHPWVFQTPEGMFIRPKLTRISEPTDLRGVPHPRVLFLGNINMRLDFRVITKMVTSSSRISFVFVGAVDPQYHPMRSQDLFSHIATLKKFPNVFFLGAKRREDIYRYIHHSDAGIIPYDTDDEFVRFSYPMKIQEFFYMGKPLLSAPISEVLLLEPLVSIYRNQDQAAGALRKLLSHKPKEAEIKKQKDIAIRNTLEEKMRTIRDILTKHFPNNF